MACTKIGYPNKAAAMKDATSIRVGNKHKSHKYCHRVSNGKKSLNPYQCRFCDQWHLSSQRQVKGKRLLTRTRRNNHETR